VITGLYRSIGSAVGETLSDPLLGWIDTAATTMFRRRQEARDALWRVAQEEPEVPDVLVTGRDIIFLWVSRMMMLTKKFTGKIAFKDCVITGTVLDVNGGAVVKL